jgi:hypothetical protein
MNCTKIDCTGRLRVTHTYNTGVAKFQRAECMVCGRVHTLQTIAEPTQKRGDGARARAKAAAFGK